MYGNSYCLTLFNTKVNRGAWATVKRKVWTSGQIESFIKLRIVFSRNSWPRDTHLPRVSFRVNVVVINHLSMRVAEIFQSIAPTDRIGGRYVANRIVARNATAIAFVSRDAVTRLTTNMKRSRRCYGNDAVCTIKHTPMIIIIIGIIIVNGASYVRARALRRRRLYLKTAHEL